MKKNMDVCPVCLTKKKPAWRKYCSAKCAHLSAVRAFNNRRKAIGQCTYCDRKLNHYSFICDFHAEERRKNQRKTKGHKAWHKGSRGPQPKALREAA